MLWLLWLLLLLLLSLLLSLLLGLLLLLGFGVEASGPMPSRAASPPTAGWPTPRSPLK